MTFRWNHSLHGMSTFGFHVFNTVAHVAVSVLFVFAARKVLRDASPLVIGVTGLLFATHPIHTESVSSIVGRAEVLSGLFVLLSFLTYTSAFREHDNVHFSVVRVVVSIVLGMVAMFCKEQGVTVIAVNAAYDFSVICELDVPGFLWTLYEHFVGGDDAVKVDQAVKDGTVKPKAPKRSLSPGFVSLLQRMGLVAAGLLVVIVMRIKINSDKDFSTMTYQTNRSLHCCLEHLAHFGLQLRTT